MNFIIDVRAALYEGECHWTPSLAHRSLLRYSHPTRQIVEPGMNLDTCHFGIRVDSLEAAESFYVGKLGFGILQRLPVANLLAVQAGAVRISIFGGASPDEVEAAARVGGQIIFRTPDLAQTIEALNGVGIEVSEIFEAPGFMKYISLRDPSGNRVDIAEYLRDPLAKV